MEQAEQDADRFLLEPGQHQRQRQIIDAAAKGVGQGHGYLDGPVGVVALPHVQKAGKPGDCAQIQVVKAVLSAAQRENQRVLRGLTDEIRVIVPARTGSVAASHQEKVTDRSGLYRLHHLAGRI